ncbi:MAG: class I SAM-dependent methyltransferase [Deltaproteobacteria bacterium]|nr:class I SAM-dependent methyltransferase [Deltaproteobacteria bacterium]
MVDDQALGVFSRVSAWTGPAAAHRVRNIIGKELKQGMKVLDIGTGPGTIPLNLKRLYPDIHFIGIDISFGMIRGAKDHAVKTGLPLPLCVGDGELLPFGTGKMDGVISLFAMHHMDHPDRFLQEIDRVLKPGGSLLIIDFHRDMSQWLFRVINTMWQTIFMFSAAKKGFSDSALSAWRKNEIQNILEKYHIERFKVRTNRLELWVTTGG